MKGQSVAVAGLLFVISVSTDTALIDIDLNGGLAKRRKHRQVCIAKRGRPSANVFFTFANIASHFRRWPSRNSGSTHPHLGCSNERINFAVRDETKAPRNYNYYQ